MDVLRSHFCQIQAIYANLWPVFAPSSYVSIIWSNSGINQYQSIDQSCLWLEVSRAIFDRAQALMARMTDPSATVARLSLSI